MIRLSQYFSRLHKINAILESEQKQWFLWVPVCLGIGIACYFSLSIEPGSSTVLAFLIIGIGLVLVGSHSTLTLVMSGFMFWIAVGFTVSKIRSSAIAGPVISSGKVFSATGWAEEIISRSGKGVRVTLYLHQIKSAKGNILPRHKTPRRIRIAIKQKIERLKPGTFIQVKVILRPPPEPIWPGGFDYARSLWFAGIGGTGFAISKPEVAVLGNSETIVLPLLIRVNSSISGIRDNIKSVIRSAIGPKYAPLAIALITGDRSGMSEEDLKALRDAGLAHILAISGLHMAIMAGTLYFLVRWLLAAFPALALKYPIKKIAAAAAIIGGLFYLLVSGAALSTQRAYIMTAVAFIAIILNRPGITLRNVAMAALMILIFKPESLLDVGFQMSFASVTALVAIYEMVIRSREKKRDEGRVITSPTIFPVRYFREITSTTIIAGLAVAPFAAYHFHKISQFSLLGNLLAMPIVGLIVMPMSLLFFLLLLFGLEFLPLFIMQWGLGMVMDISHYVASLSGAVRPVAQMPLIALIFMVMGGLWLTIWNRQWRYYGLFPIGTGLALTPALTLPDILADRDGRVVAVKTDKGSLAAPDKRGGQFSLQKWMQIYGDDRHPAKARSGKIFRCDFAGCVATIKGKTISYVRHPAALEDDCRKAEVVISRLRINRICKSAKLVIDKDSLKAKGAHAIYLNKDQLFVDSVFNYRHGRPWARAHYTQK